jgi:Uma2 family endonuclease
MLADEQMLDMSPTTEWHDTIDMDAVNLLNIYVMYNMYLSVLSLSVFEWLALLLLLRESPVSNLGPEIGYLD